MALTGVDAQNSYNEVLAPSIFRPKNAFLYIFLFINACDGSNFTSLLCKYNDKVGTKRQNYCDKSQN